VSELDETLIEMMDTRNSGSMVMLKPTDEAFKDLVVVVMQDGEQDALVLTLTIDDAGIGSFVDIYLDGVLRRSGAVIGHRRST
jgi:hypothetical protein